MNDTTDKTIEDVQGRSDHRQIPINKVGVKDIDHPVTVGQRCGGDQNTVATFNMYVDLPHNFKGTHMSRFVEILNQHDNPITVASFREMLGEMTNRLEAEVGHVEMTFPYFIKKAAPVSGVTSLMNYQATFIGEHRDNKTSVTVKVLVPVTSLCPCSKGISDRGAHNQRSHVTIAVDTDEFVWLEEIIDIAEREASSQLYGILKRPDEKYVTEHAYDHPKFVEDLVRDIAVELNKDNRIRGYVVEAENFESIHNHSAYAQVEKKA